MSSRLLAQSIELDIGTAAGAAAAPADNIPFAGQDIGVFIGQVLTFVMTISTLAVLIFLIWGALSWILAGGDKGKIQAARDRITQSIIGLIVLLSVLAVFVLVQNFFGIQVLQLDFTKRSASKAASSFGGSGSSGGATSPRHMVLPKTP